MALIDDRGRLFGRLNVIDAAIGALIVALIPLGYAALLLFREPEPTITAVEPQVITPATKRLTVTGEHFRPFLRVSLGEVQGTTFALISPTRAEVELPNDLPPGTYDVVLYDVAREVARIPGAVEVEEARIPSSVAPLLVAGAFVALDDTRAASLQQGTTLTAMGGGSAEVLTAGPVIDETRWIQVGGADLEVPVPDRKRVPALLRVECVVNDRRCQMAQVDLDPKVSFPIFTPDGHPVRFVVSDVFPDAPPTPTDVQVRFVTTGDVTGMVRAGDREMGSVLLADRFASIVSVRPAGAANTQTAFNYVVPWITGTNWTITAPSGGQAIDATVRLALDRTSEGLRYRGRPVKAGYPFSFETDRYLLRGWVLRVPEAPAP